MGPDLGHCQVAGSYRPSPITATFSLFREKKKQKSSPEWNFQQTQKGEKRENTLILIPFCLPSLQWLN